MRLQFLQRLLHVVDLERDQPVAQVFLLWRRADRDAGEMDQFDGRAAQVEIGEVETRPVGPLHLVARLQPEAENFGVELFGFSWLVGDDLDMVDALEHQPLSSIQSAFPAKAGTHLATAPHDNHGSRLSPGMRPRNIVLSTDRFYRKVPICPDPCTASASSISRRMSRDHWAR